MEATPEPFFLHLIVRGFCGNPQRYALVRFQGGSAASKRRLLPLVLTPMILITWCLMPAGMYTRWDRKTSESEIYFAYNILTDARVPFRLTLEAARLRLIVRCSFVAKFISPITF